MKINGNEGRPFSILLRGCSSLLMYEAGVLAALRELSPDMLKSASRIYGASSGSIVATLALCECDIDEVKLVTSEALKASFWGCLPGTKCLKILKEFLNKSLPTNAHQLVSGKLHVIITRVRDCRSVVVSEFASREDLIQAVLCSCFVPLYFGFLPPVYHGVRYVDGEIGMWRADFVDRTTITVSGFAGEYDICPKDTPAAFFTFQISDCILYISKRNFCRFQYIFQIPSCQVLEQFYTHGYQDTVSFLKRLSEFGINYLDEDFMLSLANESCQKGEGTPHWKPETRVLRFRATDPEHVTKENPGTIQAADEVEEEASRHLLHHQKVLTRKTGEPSAFRIPVCHTVTSGIQRRPCQPQKSIFDPAAAFGPSSHFKERKSNLQPSLQTDTKMH